MDGSDPRLFVPNDNVAHLGTEPVPVEPYISPSYYKLEQERIFHRCWIYMGRIEEVRKPGDFFVRQGEDSILGTSIIVAHGKDGVVRAFHNICSHRQAKLVHEPRGNKPNFQCKYHGWGYALNGELKSVPDTESFFDLDMKKCGLTPINCEMWNGFIFINLADKPAQTLTEFLGPVIPKLQEHNLEGFSTYMMMTLDVNVNWKCMLDNFQESYHLPFVHNLSLGDTAMSAKNPYSYPLYFDFRDPHRIMGVWGNTEHKTSLAESIAMKYGAVISAGTPNETTATQIKRHPNWQLDIHGIFPNLLIDVAPGFFFTHEFIPLSTNKTRWYGRVFWPKAKTAAQRWSQEYAIAAFRDTVSEDLTILDTLQKAMESGAKKEVYYQTSEAMCRHTYNTVDRYVRGDLLRAAE